MVILRDGHLAISMGDPSLNTRFPQTMHPMHPTIRFGPGSRTGFYVAGSRRGVALRVVREAIDGLIGYHDWPMIVGRGGISVTAEFITRFSVKA